MESFFHAEGDLYVGNDAARSPWFEDACHGGPVLTLVAFGLESSETDKQLCRVTATFQRPVPMDGIRLESHVERTGRSVSTASAVIRDTKGRVCVTGEGLFIATGDFGEFPTPSIPGPEFADATPGEFSVQQSVHGERYFANSIEAAYPPGESGRHGPGTMWMKTPQLFEDKKPTPFQVACPIADCGNGVARNAGFDVASFINPDVTIALHRLPNSRWLASEAISHWQPNGVGLSQATLFDKYGPIGVAIQTLIVRPA